MSRVTGHQAEDDSRSSRTLIGEPDHAAQLVGAWTQSGEVAPETVAVLVRDRATRDRVVSGLGERGVEVRVLEAGAIKPGHPVALTMHRAKGAEFTKVLLFGLSEDAVPMGLKVYDYDEARTQRSDAAGTLAGLRGRFQGTRRTGGHVERPPEFAPTPRATAHQS